MNFAFVSAGRNCWAVFRRWIASTNAVFQHDRVSETANVCFNTVTAFVLTVSFLY